MSKCEKARLVIKEIFQEVTNDIDNIIVGGALYDIIDKREALAELDAIESENARLEDANIKLVRKVCKARGRIKELEAELESANNRASSASADLG